MSSLFFRDDINFNSYYAEYTIKKTTNNISSLIPLRKLVDMTQLKNTKKKTKCITSVTFYATAKPVPTTTSIRKQLVYDA